MSDAHPWDVTTLINTAAVSTKVLTANSELQSLIHKIPHTKCASLAPQRKNTTSDALDPKIITGWLRRLKAANAVDGEKRPSGRVFPSAGGGPSVNVTALTQRSERCLLQPSAALMKRTLFPLIPPNLPLVRGHIKTWNKCVKPHKLITVIALVFFPFQFFFFGDNCQEPVKALRT